MNKQEAKERKEKVEREEENENKVYPEKSIFVIFHCPKSSIFEFILLATYTSVRIIRMVVKHFHSSN